MECCLCSGLVVLLIGSVVFYRGLLLQVFSYLLHFLSSTLPICFTTRSPYFPYCLIPHLLLHHRSGGLVNRWYGRLVVLFFCSYGLFYPIHPVSFTLIFTPLLNFLFKPNLTGRGLVKVVRNSTYKVGWEERQTNQ